MLYIINDEQEIKGCIQQMYNSFDSNVLSIYTTTYLFYITIYLFPSLILEFTVTWAGRGADILRQKHGLQLIHLPNPSNIVDRNLSVDRSESLLEFLQLH